MRERSVSVRRPERILLIRSGRHLQVAIDVLRRTYPVCAVAVIATPGTEGARVQAGIAPPDWLIYDAAPHFDAWPMMRGGLAARAWMRGFDRVAVLWQDPDGTDRANVDRAAFVLAPRGFDAITPDGALIRRQTSTVIRRQAATLWWSAATAVVLAAALYAPAAALSAMRGVRRHKAAQ